ncbi:sulfotransferase [bacterium]
MKEWLRRWLIQTADWWEGGIKYLRGAAYQLAPESSISLADCESQNWLNVRPCFVLSTGRSGTLFLNRLLILSPDIMALHQPSPELIRASKQAYENIYNNPATFQETFKSAREELLLYAANRNKTYTETNNRITFFAPIIRDCFPNAVFIHLVRHPGDVVRSGIRRNWYSGKSSHDPGRIVPVSGEMIKEWDTVSLIGKIGWLWNETNQFIEDFKKQLPEENCLFIRAEDLFKDIEIAASVFPFIKVDPPSIKKIQKLMQRPANEQRKGQFPRYKDWSDEDQEILKRFCPLAQKYGYF